MAIVSQAIKLATVLPSNDPVLGDNPAVKNYSLNHLQINGSVIATVMNMNSAVHLRQRIIYAISITTDNILRC